MLQNNTDSNKKKIEPNWVEILSHEDINIL